MFLQHEGTNSVVFWWVFCVGFFFSKFPFTALCHLKKPDIFLAKVSLLSMQTGFLMCCYFKMGFRIISCSLMGMNESDLSASIMLQKLCLFGEIQDKI